MSSIDSRSTGAITTASVVHPSSPPLDQYSFFQALRQIERQRRWQPRIGHALRPSDEPVRIGQPAELTFAPSTLVADRAESSDPTVTASEQSPPGPKYVQQRFLGLLGPAGPMPLHVTEWVRDRQRHAGDKTLQAFLDLFHHRAATLFYRAWSDAQPVVQHDRAEDDRFARYLGSLSGIGSAKDWLSDCLRYFAGHFSGVHRHAEGLESILSCLLQSPTCVSSFALRTLELAADQRSALTSQRLGSRPPTNCLGSSAQLGSTVADRTSMIEVAVGPVTYDQYQQYLPGGRFRSRLTSVIRQYAGAGLDARVTVELRQEQVPQTVLGRSGQLGRSCWMHSLSATTNRRDYRFEIIGVPPATSSAPTRGAA